MDFFSYFLVINFWKETNKLQYTKKVKNVFSYPFFYITSEYALLL